LSWGEGEVWGRSGGVEGVGVGGVDEMYGITDEKALSFKVEGGVTKESQDNYTKGGGLFLRAAREAASVGKLWQKIFFQSLVTISNLPPERPPLLY
jgi:hypothetical protein